MAPGRVLELLALCSRHQLKLGIQLGSRAVFDLVAANEQLVSLFSQQLAVVVDVVVWIAVGAAVVVVGADDAEQLLHFVRRKLMNGMVLRAVVVFLGVALQLDVFCSIVELQEFVGDVAVDVAGVAVDVAVAAVEQHDTVAVVVAARIVTVEPAQFSPD